MEQQSSRHTRQIVAALAVLIVIVAIVAAATLGKDDDSASTGDPNTTSQPAMQNASYKDGSYRATGGYNSPGGAEKITVNITLQNGKIADTSVIPGADGGEAAAYQNNFISGYKTQVVGKDINGVRLSRVAGSSLTSQGFNNAIQQIKDQARQ